MGEHNANSGNIWEFKPIKQLKITPMMIVILNGISDKYPNRSVLMDCQQELRTVLYGDKLEVTQAHEHIGGCNESQHKDMISSYNRYKGQGFSMKMIC